MSRNRRSLIKAFVKCLITSLNVITRLSCFDVCYSKVLRNVGQGRYTQYIYRIVLSRYISNTAIYY